MWSHKLYSFICNAFRPPFRTTPWIILVYVILSVINHGQSNFNRWSLPDTDDYIRFVQVFNWLDGQSWFDLSLPHLYPRHIITMHWGRLPDVPLAGLILLFGALSDFFQFHLTRQTLAMAAAFLVPLGMLLALLHVVRLNARSLLGRNHAGVTAFMVILALQLMFQFMPMRVDHHAYILLSAGTAFFALQNLALKLRPLRMAVLAALALALGMWNGAEILPMLALFCIGLSALMLSGTKRDFLPGLVFGASLFLFSACLLLVTRTPDTLFSVEYDTFSVFYVIMAGFAAGYFALLFLVAQAVKNRAILASGTLFIALTTLWGFIQYFPDIVLGPYAKTNPLLNTIFFPNIREAIPFTKSWADLSDAFGSAPKQSIGGGLYYITTRLFVPFTGIMACLYGLLRKNASKRQRTLWALYAFFAVSYSLLAFFWQVRVLTYAQLFTIVPMTWLMLHYLSSLPRNYSGRALYMWESITVFSFTIFPVLVVPAILAQHKFMPDMLFYLGKGTDFACDNRGPIITALSQIEKTRKTPATIMAPMDYTPEFMFYTSSNYIAAPYHRNDRGIIAMASFFHSRPDDRTARAIAKDLGLDYVVLCRAASFQSNLLGGDGDIYEQKTADDGKTVENVVRKDVLPGATLGVRLVSDRIPAWLKPIPLKYDTQFLLFEVQKQLLGKADK